jgi:hypothetical protein
VRGTNSTLEPLDAFAFCENHTPPPVAPT